MNERGRIPIRQILLVEFAEDGRTDGVVTHGSDLWNISDLSRFDVGQRSPRVRSLTLSVIRMKKN